MQYRYICVEDWPPLAWLAKCPISNSEVTVYHGNRVETQKEWFCEAVWDNRYELGNFDQTDIVFGSGGRIRGNKIIFVSSGSTLDRLHSLQSEEYMWVSNSIVCLLSASQAQLNPTYPSYLEDFHTIKYGLNNYKRTFLTLDVPIQLTYFDNLKWESGQLIKDIKPYLTRDFSSFSKYRNFLETSLQNIAENMSSTSRKYPYKMLGTLSSGYDSPTIVALARRFGLEEVISFDVAQYELSESTEKIAEILGVRRLLIKRDAWSRMKMPEVPFIASDGGGEDVYYKGAEDRLSGRVLLTGFHGDKVWDPQNKALTDDIVRGDCGGLSLCEYRLWIGFIHCPVPFMGVRQIRDINKISNSSEMLYWNVSGMVCWDLSIKYSRPICRRIIEESGVPRHKFGVRKKAVSVHFFDKDRFFSSPSLKDYLSWLRKNSCLWFKNEHLAINNDMVNIVNYLQVVLKIMEKVYYAITRIILAPCKTHKACISQPMIRRLVAFCEFDIPFLIITLGDKIGKILLGFLGQEHLLRQRMFLWAAEKAKTRYMKNS